MTTVVIQAVLIQDVSVFHYVLIKRHPDLIVTRPPPHTRTVFLTGLPRIDEGPHFPVIGNPSTRMSGRKRRRDGVSREEGRRERGVGRS